MFKPNNKQRKKLTEEDVCKIRMLYNDKSKTLVELAKKFDVTPRTISDIITGRTWNLERKQKRFDRYRKLADKDVQEIREMYKTGKYLQLDLAKKYHVNQTLISAIIRNKIFKDIQEN